VPAALHAKDVRGAGEGPRHRLPTGLPLPAPQLPLRGREVRRDQPGREDHPGRLGGQCGRRARPLLGRQLLSRVQGLGLRPRLGLGAAVCVKGRSCEIGRF